MCQAYWAPGRGIKLDSVQLTWIFLLPLDWCWRVQQRPGSEGPRSGPRPGQYDFNLSGFDAHQKPHSDEAQPDELHPWRPGHWPGAQFNISQRLAKGFRVCLWISVPFNFLPSGPGD